jgi:hypothetical protein
VDDRLEDGRRLVDRAGEYVEDRVRDGRKAVDGVIDQGKRKLNRLVRA